MNAGTDAMMKISPLAGLPPPPDVLIDVDKLISAYYDVPDIADPLQRISFGTSGHRGSAFNLTFNELHVLAITQAICHYRRHQGIDGPLFMGIDTHALSVPAFRSALEVLAGNGVHVMAALDGEYTPTPAVSLAILTYNDKRSSGLADGIVITPSHNPPEDGGFKYNPPNGGPADTDVTTWIEHKANEILLNGSANDVKRIPFERALHAQTTHAYDFMAAYVLELESVIDMQAIRASGIRMGVDPMGGAGVHYWPMIAGHYQLDLSVLNSKIDATFSFMPVDWDGRIRMDPSSVYAMQSLIAKKDDYTLAFACDTDHDRYGIVTPGSALIPANHYFSAAVDYLLRFRPDWNQGAAIGKTIASTQMIDRVADDLKRNVYEVPVGFKWFAAGLRDATLGVCGEESAGASFLRRNGKVWTTDKDGIAAALLSAEMTARTGRDPAQAYDALSERLGTSFAKRIQAPATAQKRKKLAGLSAQQMTASTLAGDPILAVLTRAPGNNEPIGGLKAVTAQGWFAARPSGTEDIYKIYAESFRDEQHLSSILIQAQAMVDAALEE